MGAELVAKENRGQSEPLTYCDLSCRMHAGGEWGQAPACAAGETMVSAERLAAALTGRHDWSEAGAAVVVALAADYGAFMLRNALALALALDVEDGRLGF